MTDTAELSNARAEIERLRGELMTAQQAAITCGNASRDARNQLAEVKEWARQVSERTDVPMGIRSAAYKIFAKEQRP